MTEVQSTITMADISEAIRDGHLRSDFVARIRIGFESDEELLGWLVKPNSFYNLATPWELFYGERTRQGAYLDATCNIFVGSLYKRHPDDLPALPPAPSED